MTTEKPTREQVFEQMAANPSDEMAFHMTRERREPNTSFSAEALTEFNDAVTTFIGSRLVHHWNKDTSQPGPLDIKVLVRVSIDGQEPIEVPDDQYPWFVIDGSRRHGAH